jgi:hypothetical protein
VPGLRVMPVVGLPPPPPHATKPVAKATRSRNATSVKRRPLRRIGISKSKIQARKAPLEVSQRPSGFQGLLTAMFAGAVVVTVRVAVAGLAPVITTGLVEPKLKVGKLTAPLGLDVIAALSVTEPVKPPIGETVMVEALPAVAPGATVTAVPLIVNVGGGMFTVY